MIVNSKARKPAFIHQLEIGAVLYTSWGYEQTNVEFYEVVRVVSEKSVEIRQIETEIVEYHKVGMAGYKMPRRGKYCGDRIVKRVLRGLDDTARIKLSSYCNAWLWDGRKRRFSEYG